MLRLSRRKSQGNKDPMDRNEKLHALAAALAALPGWQGADAAQLEDLRDTGLAHDHFRILGSPWLLRVPKQSQFGYSARDNLAYQAACFQRVSVSGHAPGLGGVIEPSPAVPMGALLVRFIEGRPPRLPEELPLLAEAMARVHALPLPEADARPPLEDHGDPVAGIWREIRAQAESLPAAHLSPEAASEIGAELAWAEAFAEEVARRRPEQPVTLVLTDTHPGNFLVTPEGKAVIVDLEKALYGSPGVDLAHASIYSSTTWDLATQAELSSGEVAAFYRRYLEIARESGGAAFAEALRPWLIPMRRLLFLRAITWCALWRVSHETAARAAKESAESTRDWSAENSDPALIAHVKGRTDLYLSAAVLKRMRAEWLESPGLEDLIG
jgi:aminoglycoside phosphotransferase (APT) family kinase protein